jgi:methyl-accepting chemotaxis protein
MAAVEQINRGSQQQATATQQTSAAVAQIEASASIAQKNASIADDRVKVMGAALKESRDALEHLTEGVDKALRDNRASLAGILSLEKIGRKMDKIVGSIGLVTVQTTMLAVSGSVEAARAGDAGRGFAVVSNDIRALAREASDSVESAVNMVSGILDQLNALRHELEQIIAGAEIEVESNRTIYAAFETIEENVTALAIANKTILGGSEDIFSAAGQMAEGARQVAAAADEASSAAREASTAASQQARGAEDLAAAIEEIASLADELKHQDG